MELLLFHGQNGLKYFNYERRKKLKIQNYRMKMTYLWKGKKIQVKFGQLERKNTGAGIECSIGPV